MLFLAVTFRGRIERCALYVPVNTLIAIIEKRDTFRKQDWYAAAQRKMCIDVYYVVSSL